MHGMINKNFMNNSDKNYHVKLQERIHLIRLENANKPDENISSYVGSSATNPGSKPAPNIRALPNVANFRRNGTIQTYLSACPSLGRAGKKHKPCTTMTSNQMKSNRSEQGHETNQDNAAVGATASHPNLRQNYEHMLHLCKIFFDNYWSNGINAMKYGTIVYKNPLSHRDGDDGRTTD